MASAATGVTQDMLSAPRGPAGRRAASPEGARGGDDWALLLAGLVAAAVRVLDEHRRDRAGACRVCGGRWPCESAGTAEMNLALVRV